MKRILLTGMSGTGKSTMLKLLASDRIVTLDLDDWIREDPMTEERRIPVDRVRSFFARHPDRHVVLAGCEENQGELAPWLDAVVLLTAEPAVLRRRILARRDNPFGKAEAEWEKILRDLREIEPLLRARCTCVIDTDRPPAEVARMIRSACGLPGEGTADGN